ncbi:hypothetical protein HPB48_018539 [Haemaphysalis longicornis]|uniref:ABCA1-4-like C-terminal R2 regulatory domain-containing protein n=1 Tax=Haemaphysalis longicornis TaxID=44386 RepID=A0A9J6G9Q2_HAELO|nr:hypothetical protein HPB48_018539 [Haemaphysalis longicornis]
MGLPQVLLLDEPYKGIGSSARRHIVNYISAFQRLTKASILMSTHNMTDVEFLCNRIAILTEGRLQCLGTLAHLKDKFGKGYTITIKTLPDRREDYDYQYQVIHGVCRLFPHAELVHNYEEVLEFRLSRVQMLWSDMFTQMARIKKHFKLQNFFITDTSLQQIFISVSRKEATQAAVAAAEAAVAKAKAPALPPTVASVLGI